VIFKYYNPYNEFYEDVLDDLESFFKMFNLRLSCDVNNEINNNTWHEQYYKFTFNNENTPTDYVVGDDVVFLHLKNY